MLEISSVPGPLQSSIKAPDPCYKLFTQHRTFTKVYGYFLKNSINSTGPSAIPQKYFFIPNKPLCPFLISSDFINSLFYH